MNKNSFYSKLFQREINKTDKGYHAYIKAELLFRIKELEEKNCSCFDCTMELDRYKKYYSKKYGKDERKSIFT